MYSIYFIGVIFLTLRANNINITTNIILKNQNVCSVRHVEKINSKAEGYDLKKYIGYFDSLFLFDIFTGLV